MASPLISASDLKSLLGAPHVKLIDATWHMPGTGRSGAADYENGHIPGAVFMDIDAVSDASIPLPHMLPPARSFAEHAGTLGITPDDHVIVYDQHGLFSAPRVWWMFRAFGHAQVSVLDGGLPAWRAIGGPVTDEVPVTAPVEYTINAAYPHLLANIEGIHAALQAHDYQIADARSPSRFSGEEADPRPGVRPGHMPGSRNVHYRTLLKADEIHLKDPEALRETFEKAGIDPLRPVITTCGSGVTACILALGFEMLGNRQWVVYDGSWAEWGGRADTPVETGQASA